MPKKEHHVGVKMDDDLKRKAQTLADEDSRTVSGLIRVLIERAWERREKASA